MIRMRGTRLWKIFNKAGVNHSTIQPKPPKPKLVHDRDGGTVHRYATRCTCGRTFTSRSRKAANQSLADHITNISIPG